MKQITTYFSELTPLQYDRFSRLQELYQFWNQQINVISRKDINSFYTNHVLHSLAIAKILQFRDGADILDIGTGGGFPGIPLAILFPKTKFHLVDSIGKKIKVVQEVASELNLTNVSAEQNRAENLNKQYDFIVSRAVTQMPEFLTWTKGKFKKVSNHTIFNGILYLKGGDLQQELHGISHKSFDINDFFLEDYFETKKVIYVKQN